MMMADVNVLVSAFRADHPNHPVCHAWLHELRQSGARYGVSPLVLAAVVRLCTNAQMFARPSTLSDVFGFCDYLLLSPLAVVVEPGPTHWRTFSQLCVSQNVRGPSIADAWFAALAIESGCQWITLDRGFARYPGLDWRHP